jgi:hypothetical protein
MQPVGADAPERYASADQAVAVAGRQIGLAEPLQADAHCPRDDILDRIRHATNAPAVAAHR